MVCFIHRIYHPPNGLDFEHPPAAGTSLGMTLFGYSNSAAIAIIISFLLLTIIAYLSKPYLEDLV